MTETKSVLIVEDEALIAMDMEIALEDYGWMVIGPVATVETAIDLLEEHTVDVGLLDYNLKSGTSESVAMALLSKEIPVIFLSGDTLMNCSEELKACKVLAKPVNIDHLNGVLLNAANKR